MIVDQEILLAALAVDLSAADAGANLVHSAAVRAALAGGHSDSSCNKRTGKRLRPQNARATTMLPALQDGSQDRAHALRCETLVKSAEGTGNAEEWYCEGSARRHAHG
jgi:hypothetical protein